MMNFKTLTRSTMFCLTLAGFSSAAFAQPQQCESDADCEEGFRCEVVGASGCPGAPPCEEGQECEEPEPCESEEITECVRAPIDCETDADCPEYLTCVTDSPPVACTVEPNGGEEVCEEPDPADERSFCAYEPIECAQDSDCPTDFECISFGSFGDCATIACPEGEECEQIECDEPEEQFACAPRQIECEADADCPTEWSCQTYESGGCGDVGEGTVEPDEGGSGGQEGDAEPRQEGDQDCTVETVSACVPPGFEGFGGGAVDLAANDGTGAPEESRGQNDDSASEGGADDESTCAVGALSGRSTPVGGGALLMLLAGLALVVRRR